MQEQGSLTELPVSAGGYAPVRQNNNAPVEARKRPYRHGPSFLAAPGLGQSINASDLQQVLDLLASQ